MPTSPSLSRDHGVRAMARRLPRSAIFRRHRSQALFLAALLLAAALFTLDLRPFVRTHLQALAVLDQVSGSTPSRTLQHLVTGPVRVEDILIPTTSDQPVRARLYIPAQHPFGPVLLIFHGVHHLGIDEPRLIAFARALSSCGLRVITPELPDIKDYRIDTGSIRTIGEVTRWSATQASTPVGVMGLSFSGGLSLIAAADPVYHSAFKFVFAVGSQNSMSRVATFYRTGQDPRPNGTIELLPAHEYGPLVLEYEHLEDFLPPHDLRPVRRALRAHLYEDPSAEANAAARLSPAQQGELHKLLDINSPETHHLLELSAMRHTAEMSELSPHGHLHLLATPVFLLHGEADNIIPAAETLWMAQELGTTHLQAALVSPVLSHLDLSSSKPGPRDQWRLIHFFAGVLSTADTPATPSRQQRLAAP